MYFLIFSDVKLNPQKIISRSLSDIYGIGSSRSIYICQLLGINYLNKIKFLSRYHFFLITSLFRKWFITSNRLKNQCFLHLKKLIDTNSYKGLRYISKLPMRGQRTSTNAKISKNRSSNDIHFFELTKNLKTSKFFKKKFFL